MSGPSRIKFFFYSKDSNFTTLRILLYFNSSLISLSMQRFSFLPDTYNHWYKFEDLHCKGTPTATLDILGGSRKKLDSSIALSKGEMITEDRNETGILFTATLIYIFGHKSQKNFWSPYLKIPMPKMIELFGDSDPWWIFKWLILGLPLQKCECYNSH